MNDTTERDWQALQELWRKQPVETPIPAEIRRRVQRQERRLRIGAALEWLVAVGLCTYAITFAARDWAPADIFWALVALVLVGWALSFSIANRRDLWCPPEESTSAYIDLALLRIERKRSAIRFAWLLYAVELSIFLLWELLSQFGWLKPLFTADSGRALLMVGAATLVLGGWSLFAWLGSARQLRLFKELQKQNVSFV